MSTIGVRREVLERWLVHAQREIGGRVLDGPSGLRFDLMEREAGRMVLQLRGYVWSQKLQDESVTLTVEFPASWWQAFKKRHFPGWALRRWPVKMATVSQSHRFRTVALLPGFKYESPVESDVHMVSVLDRGPELFEDYLRGVKERS